MLFRKAYQKLNQWYQTPSRALLVDGARQVGKTYLIRAFLSDQKIPYIYLNLLDNRLAREAFDTSLDAKSLLLKLTLFSGDVPLQVDKTIFFIDEIQAANDAITPLKFLVEEGSFRFIVSGSLLGVALKNIRSIPAGSLQAFTMYPMDFEEFAIANGVKKDIFTHLKDCFEKSLPVDDIVHQQMLALFHLYLIVGGFPKAVSDYLTSHNLGKVTQVHQDIDFAYQKDISQYDQKERLLIMDIYRLIPSELNNANKRFVLKKLNEKARFYLFEESFVWLRDSGVGLFAYNVDNPVFPLLASKERTLFKLFLCDVGLLASKLFKEDALQVLNGDASVNHGSLYEAFVAQELVCHGFDLFYLNSKKMGEIDFVIELGTQVVPLEIKSGKDYKRHSGLSNVLEAHPKEMKLGVIFCNDNVKVQENKHYFPIYMAMFLTRLKSTESHAFQVDLSALR